tara:strand:+ start:14974 stop:15387 length:414 start_codon:yes stop_codon:yes gene_type:complete
VKKPISVLTIDTIHQAREIISISKKNGIIPTLHIKNYIIKGFGLEFIYTFKKMLQLKYGKSSFKLYIDSGNDYGLSIDLANNKIDYIKLRANKLILNKIKSITNKNRVLLNPNSNIVDFRKIKNIKSKLSKIYEEIK